MLGEPATMTDLEFLPGARQHKFAIEPKGMNVARRTKRNLSAPEVFAKDSEPI
jgi:hypothetical protein